MTTDKISRRTLGGLAAAGVGVPLLAACSSDDPGTATDPTGRRPRLRPARQARRVAPRRDARPAAHPQADG